MFSMLDDADAVCTLLQQGEIVAIKGLGGFHLACDATNVSAVEKLRQRKHRYHKPFALMARDLQIITTYCRVNTEEQGLLESAAAPIVLLERLPQEPDEPGLNSHIPPIADAVAPGQANLGFMLPYTPLHHLILMGMNRPIVLTSGNISDQPQCIDNDDARQQLAGIADYFLFHNREIVNRLDDSVVRVVENTPQILRRARGYAPAPIRLPAGFQQAPPLLAMGSELKSTFCLVRDGQAILSQHLGDLADVTALDAYQQTLKLYLQLFEHQPTAVAYDLHPAYLASQLGRDYATTHNLPIFEIQHHHAHIAACMAENGLPLTSEPVLGVALDGLGYGEDGQLWGGEFLWADYRQYRRLAHLQPIAMLGGEQAVHQPWRSTYAHLVAAAQAEVNRSPLTLAERLGLAKESDEQMLESLWQRFTTPYQLELLDFLNQQPRPLLNQMLTQGINSPRASSCGRLFDAVAAAVGLCRSSCSYEGQGAIALENLATDYFHTAQQQPYPFANSLSPDGLPMLEAAPLWTELLRDLQRRVSPATIAARFHLGLAVAIVDMVTLLNQQHNFTQVALSGGVWQNQMLFQQVSKRLARQGLTVLSHHQIPTNDGGLSLGQAVIAAARIIHPVDSIDATLSLLN
jgi:hydrogenase maturation protein HypF